VNEPLSVLIVDDEPPILQFVQRVLNRAGMRTWIAADGFEAATLFTTIDHVDVLVTDLQMPGMNGDELAKRLRAHAPTLRVLYLSGSSGPRVADSLCLAENDAFLEKPCAIDALVNIVSSGRS
jgi:CheY-like chemotaxis protein